MIPYVFDITCDLAKEYNIKFLRTTLEPRYFSLSKKDIYRLFGHSTNLLKYFLLNKFATTNKKLLNQYGLSTNDNFIGVLYTGIMSPTSIIAGLNSRLEGVTELLFHPCSLHLTKKELYLPYVRDYILDQNRDEERKVLTSKKFYDLIRKLGYDITNYSYLLKQKNFNKQFPCREQSNYIENSKSIEKRKLRLYIIIDETPFYHPEYVEKIINECPHSVVVGATVVNLPSGGVLQKYLIDHWRILGVTQLFKLAINKYLKIVKSKVKNVL